MQVPVPGPRCGPFCHGLRGFGRRGDPAARHAGSRPTGADGAAEQSSRIPGPPGFGVDMDTPVITG